MKKITCEWPTTPLYHEYHDHEWGRPIHDDQHQFEHLCLESLQCGLSWLTILNKRDIIRGCFDNFDIEVVSSYGESDIDRIMQTEGMLKSRPLSIALKSKLSSIMLLPLNVFNLNLVRFVTIFGGSQIIRQLSMKIILKGISLLKMVYPRGLAKT